MEILLEKEDHGSTTIMEPGHVFDQGDRVRFRFTPNFNGTLFVMNRGTSGSYTMLFPKQDTGTNDRLEAGHAYVLPATDQGWFRINGPPGHDIVYFIVSTKHEPGSHALPPPAPAEKHDPSSLMPRCNDALFRARGECIDSSAGAKAPGDNLPETLTGMKARDLFFIRKDKASVVSSKESLDAPVVYEFHIAHK